MPPRSLTLVDGELAAVVDLEIGGRIASLQVGGLEVLVTSGPGAYRWGLFPMAPWAGRIREGRFHHAGATHRLPLTAWPHAIHGTVADRPWTVVDAGPSSCTLERGLGPTWPYAGRARHGIELAGTEVHLRLEVSADGEAFPASCGWHPWFARRLDRGGSVEIGLDAGSMWERGADGLPTGALVLPTAGPWDDCFTDLAGPPTLHWPGALALEVRTSCPHVVMFDERPEGVCVEPQTAPPDALNLAPEEVGPGRPLVAETTLAFEPGGRDGAVGRSRT